MDYTKDELGQEISKRITEHAKQTQTFIDNCFTFDKMYRCVPEDKRSSQDGENRTFANTFVPEFFQDVETVVSALDALIFTEQPWLSVTPDELSDTDQEKAENTQALLEKQVEGTAWNPRLRTKMLPAIRSFVINGTCIGKVPWEYRTRMAADGINFVDKVMKDGPGFKNIPLWRFHFDPYASNIEDATWVAEKYRTSTKEAKGLIERARGMVGATVNELSDEMLKNSGNSASKGVDDTGVSVGDNIRQGRGYTLESDKRPEIVEYWGENPDDKNSPVDWRIVTVNGNVVIKMPNPYSHGLKPYVKGCFINLDESFYGLGLGSILKLPQSELNDFRNLMRDILNFSLNHPWQKEGGTNGKHKERLKLKPQMTLDVIKDGRFTPLAPNTNAIQNGLIMEDRVVNGMRSESAASAVQQGVPTDVSAREISAMGNASDRRLLSLATVLVDTVVRPVLWVWHELNKQYKSEPEMVTVQSPNGDAVRRAVSGIKVEEDLMTGLQTTSSDLLVQPDLNVILSVDADGRKGMIRRITIAFDTLLTAQEKLVGKVDIDFPPIIKELVRLMGIRPMSIVKRVPPMAMPPMGAMPGEPGLQAPGGQLPPPPPDTMPTGAVSEGLTPVPDLPPGTPIGVSG